MQQAGSGGGGTTAQVAAELEATVAALQAKLLAAEERHKERLAAETELLQDSIAALGRRAEEAEAAAASERDTTADLQDQLGRREHLVAQLQQQLEEQQVAAGELQAQLASAGASEELSAVNQALSQELAASQRQAEERDAAALAATEEAELLKQQVSSLREAAKQRAAACTTAEARVAALEAQVIGLQSQLETAAGGAAAASSLELKLAALEQQLGAAAEDKAAALEAVEAQKAAALAAAEMQVASLQGQVSSLQQQVQSLEAAADANKGADPEQHEAEMSSLRAQLVELAAERDSLAAKLQGAEADGAGAAAALAEAKARCEELEGLLSAQHEEHASLEKQMIMELTMAEKQAQQAQQGLQEAQQAHAAAVAAAQEQTGAQAAAGSGERVSDMGAAAQAAAEQEQHVADLEAKVKRLEAETSRLAESERQTAAELGQRLLQISAKGQQAADSLLEPVAAGESSQLPHIQHHFSHKIALCLQAHVSELEEALAGRDEELAALEAELHELKASSGGSKQASPNGKAGPEHQLQQQVDVLMTRLAETEAALAAAESIAATAAANLSASVASADEVTELQARIEAAEEAVAAAESLRPQLQAAEQEVAEAQHQADAARSSAAGLDSAVAELKSKLQVAEWCSSAATASSEAVVAGLEQQLGEEEEQTATLHAQLAAAPSGCVELAVLQGQLAEAQQQAGQTVGLQQQVATLHSQLASAPSGGVELAVIQGQLAGTRLQAAELKQQVATLHSQLAAASSGSIELAVLQGQLAAAQQQSGQTEALQQQVASLQSELATKHLQVGELQAALAAAEQAAAAASADALSLQPSDSFQSELGTPRPISGTGAPASPSSAPAPDVPAEGDAATLQAEVSRLAKELQDTKRKFVLIAKKKQQEHANRVKELETKLAGVESAHAAVEQQLAVSRSQLADTRAMMDSSQSSVHGQLSQWKSLADEKESRLAQQAAEVHRLENELRMLHTKHAGALAELKAQHQQEREGLQAQLEAKEREVAAAQEGIEAAERKLADSNREAVGKMDASADKASEVAAELEASRAEVAQIRQQQEAERARVKKAISEMKRKIDGLQKEKLQVELASAESRGQAVAELEALRAKADSAEQQVQAAKDECRKVENELRDYKARAHALLKSKERELKAARDIAREEYEGSQADAEARAAAAEQQCKAACQQLVELQASTAAQVQALTAKYEPQLAELRQAVDHANDGADAAKRQYEQLKLRYESLELRAQQAAQQLAAAAAQAVEAQGLHEQFERLQEEYAALRASSDAASGSRQGELAQLKATAASLRDEIADLRSVNEVLRQELARQPAPGFGPQGSSDLLQGLEERSASGISSASLQPSSRQRTVSEQGNGIGDVPATPDGAFMQLSALAEKERELAAARQRASTLEAEVADLEQECVLRQAQETALKEAVRDLEREMERQRLPGKTADMEYFKNVMLKLFETGEAESLLPVVAQVLQFSPSELARCRTALHARSEQVAASNAASQAKPPRMVNLFLPGGTSHHLISNALAGAMRGRGWRTAAILADFDARSLAAKGLLDRGLETIVFQTPPKSSEQYQAMLSEVQDKPNELIKLHTQHFDSLCRNLLEDSTAMEALRSMNPDLLLLDSLLNCGHAPFSSAFNAVPYSPAVHSFIGAGFSHPLTFKERAINALVSPLVLRLGLKLTTAMEQRLAQDFNLPFVGPEAASHSARLILINSAAGLGPTRSLPPRLVGPLLVHGEPEPLPTALERIMAQAGPQGVVYTSLGTTFRAASCDTIQGLAGALALLNRTAIWQIAADSLPVGCPLGSLDLPPSVHIMPWVPQSDLLGHPQLKAMLTHGGANSLLEAAYTGTPLVCMPLAADQYDGCAKAAQGGWGQVLKKAELRAATASLLAAMLEGAAADGSQFAQRAAHASALLRAHPRPMLQQAADWIEYALALPPGTDLLDPAMLMPWWRRQCLDVYALAAVVAGTVVPGHTTPKRRRAAGLLGWVSSKNCAHFLKLRHSAKISPHTRLELGLDLEVKDGAGHRQMLHNSAPGAIEMNPLWVSYNRLYHVGRPGAWWEVPLAAKLGVTFTGKPYVNVGIENPRVALLLGALLLASGKTVSTAQKEIGGLAVHFPITLGNAKRDYSLQERLEVDATLRGHRRGLQLDFHQLNGLLRLRQD
ncbi:UDP-glucuronosyltransferase 3A2 [Chlorella vulgaris]